MDHITRIETLEADMREVKANQINYMGKHHELDKEMVGIKSDLQYVRAGLDKLTGNINKLILTVAGGFGLAIVGFIVNGGLS
jgi:3-keto-L-gulonate-6-phosphate decarboxylase